MAVPKLLPTRSGGTVLIHLRPGCWGRAAPRCSHTGREQLLSGPGLSPNR